MNLDKITFIVNEDAYYLFRDLYNVRDISKYMIKNKGHFLSILQKIHTNKKIAKYIWLPFRDVWFDYKSIMKNIIPNGIVIVNSSAMVMLNYNFWKYIKHKFNVKICLVLVDSIHGHSAHMCELKERLKNSIFDLILSYDQNDCKEFGYTYIGFDYYSIYMDIDNSIHITDLYYISSVKKGKEEVLKQIFKESNKHGVRVLFKIYSLWRIIDYGETIRKLLPYEAVISDVLSSNCILEVLQSGQSAQSLRYIEGLVYNKKLLTNNENVKKLPYYDSRYMKFFKSVDDIDWEWVKKREYVNYNLDKKFSSRNILDYLSVLEK